MKIRKVLVTGSRGFIGSALVSALKREGIGVEEYDIKIDPKDDVINYERIYERVLRSEPIGIIHLAAVSRVEDGFLNPLLCVEVNLGGTANMLEVMRDLKTKQKNAPWLILGSSREVFGEPRAEDLPITENSPKNPINVYGVAKLAGEMLAKNYAENYGVKTWVLRFANVYTGINDRPERVIPRFIHQAISDRPLTVNGGKQVFAFTYINDVIKGVIRCTRAIDQTEQLFDDFNLLGEKINICELAKLIIQLSGSKSAITFGPPRQYDVNIFWGNPEKAGRKLGWKATTPIRAGLQKSIKMFKPRVNLN